MALSATIEIIKQQNRRRKIQERGNSIVKVGGPRKKVPITITQMNVDPSTTPTIDLYEFGLTAIMLLERSGEFLAIPIGKAWSNRNYYRGIELRFKSSPKSHICYDLGGQWVVLAYYPNTIAGWLGMDRHLGENGKQTLTLAAWR